MTFQLNWRREFARLEPHLQRGGAVVRIKYASDDCAPNQFNALIKDKFASHGTSGDRFSVRLNPLWHTTHTFDDILDQFEQKLAAVGHPVSTTTLGTSAGAMFNNNEAGGDIHVSIENSTIATGGHLSAMDRKRRVRSICAALELFLGSGGKVLVEVIDSTNDYQSQIWHHFWNAGLADLVRLGLLLIYMVGPKSFNREHPESPVPDDEITLPQSFETEDERQDTVCDDLITVFEETGGLPRDLAWAAAISHLNATKQSVSAVHDGLTGALLKFKTMRPEV